MPCMPVDLRGWIVSEQLPALLEPIDCARLDQGLCGALRSRWVGNVFSGRQPRRQPKAFRHVLSV